MNAVTSLMMRLKTFKFMKNTKDGMIRVREYRVLMGKDTCGLIGLTKTFDITKQTV